MDKIRYYQIAGVGSIIALELAQYEDYTEIAWPAVASNVVDRNGQVLLQLSNFVPEFLTENSEINKSIKIPQKFIILRSPVLKNLEETYKGWQQKTHQKTTGIIVPEIRSGRALN